MTYCCIAEKNNLFLLGYNEYKYTTKWVYNRLFLSQEIYRFPFFVNYTANAMDIFFMQNNNHSDLMTVYLLLSLVNYDIVIELWRIIQLIGNHSPGCTIDASLEQGSCLSKSLDLFEDKQRTRFSKRIVIRKHSKRTTKLETYFTLDHYTIHQPDTLMVHITLSVHCNEIINSSA